MRWREKRRLFRRWLADGGPEAELRRKIMEASQENFPHPRKWRDTETIREMCSPTSAGESFMRQELARKIEILEGGEWRRAPANDYIYFVVSGMDPLYMIHVQYLRELDKYQVQALMVKVHRHLLTGEEWRPQTFEDFQKKLLTEVGRQPILMANEKESRRKPTRKGSASAGKRRDSGTR